MKKKVRPPEAPKGPADPKFYEAPLPTARRSGKCVVCGEDTAPNSTEGLCWVCRRLKISAWRDADIQMSAQE